MSGINFNFNRSADPLLGSAPDYQAHYAELEQAQKAIEQKKQAIMQLVQGGDPGAAPQSRTPIWDEMDSITANMSQAEFKAMQEQESYQTSLQALMDFVGAKQLQMIRPVVEQDPEGRKLLEQHLTTVKYLRKAALDDVDKTMASFKDYTENYSHMSWDDYLKTKGGKKK